METTETAYLSPPPAAEVTLFTKRAITIAAGLGGPLAGTYLLARNFRSLGRTDASRKATAIGVLLSLAAFTAIAFVPGSSMDRIPRSFLPIIEAGIFYLVVETYQQKEIVAHLGTGGKKGSWRVILAASLISVILSLAYFLFVFILVPHADTTFAGTPYAFASTGCTIYYDRGSIQESDLKTVGALLEEAGYFSRDTRLAAGLREENGDYVVELEVDKDHWEDQAVRDDIAVLVYRLNKSSGGHYYHVRCVSFNLAGEKSARLFGEKK